MATAYARDAIAIDPIRADIHARIAELGRDYRRLNLQEIGRRVDMLCQMGRRHGFDLIRQIAGSLSDAIARDGHGALIPNYLCSLEEAALCDSSDPRNGELFLASISVRMTGG